MAIQTWFPVILNVTLIINNWQSMNIIKRILKAFLLVITALVFGFIGLILYAMISDYKPEEKGYFPA